MFKGCKLPDFSKFPGKVISTASFSNFSFNSFSLSSISFSLKSKLISSFRSFTSLPKEERCSGGISFMLFKSEVTSPLFPTYFGFNSSKSFNETVEFNSFFAFSLI